MGVIVQPNRKRMCHFTSMTIRHTTINLAHGRHVDRTSRWQASSSWSPGITLRPAEIAAIADSLSFVSAERSITRHTAFMTVITMRVVDPSRSAQAYEVPANGMSRTSRSAATRPGSSSLARAPWISSTSVTTLGDRGKDSLCVAGDQSTSIADAETVLMDLRMSDTTVENVEPATSTSQMAVLAALRVDLSRLRAIQARSSIDLRFPKCARSPFLFSRTGSPINLTIRIHSASTEDSSSIPSLHTSSTAMRRPATRGGTTSMSTSASQVPDT